MCKVGGWVGGWVDEEKEGEDFPSFGVSRRGQCVSWVGGWVGDVPWLCVAVVVGKGLLVLGAVIVGELQDGVVQSLHQGPGLAGVSGWVGWVNGWVGRHGGWVGTYRLVLGVGGEGLAFWEALGEEVEGEVAEVLHAQELHAY